MSIDAKQAAHIAHLARIAVDEPEQVAADLSPILGWVEHLQEVDTTDVEPMTGVGEHQLRLREDVVEEGQCQEALLAGAPQAEFGCYVVPRVVE